MLSSILFGKEKKDRTAPNDMRSLGVFPLASINATPVGLKTIADSSLDSPRRSNCVKRAFITASLSPPVINDRGMACKDEEEDDDDNACWATYGRRNPCRRRFPPPIPLLARTGNLASHMPWVLKRIYKDDGSLVIQEIPVEHHEYFRARRRNGRLTLQLIELDDHHISEEIGIETEELDKGDVLSSSSPHCSSEEEELITQGSEPAMDFESIPVMRTPWLASSSLPEPICGTETMEKEDGRPLHLQLPLSRMRMVHG